MNRPDRSYQVEETTDMKPFPARPLAWCVTIAVLMLADASAVLAQSGDQSAGTSGQTAGTSGPAAPDAKKPAAEKLKVTRASQTARLGEQLDVYVSDLTRLNAEAAGAPLTLYLDGFPMKGLKPREEVGNNALHFLLDFTEVPETQNAWGSLLKISPHPRVVSVSVGYGNLVLPSDASTQLDEELKVTGASESTRIGNELTVYVTDVKRLIAQAGSAPLTLYLDGYALKGLTPGYELGSDALYFRLDRTDIRETQDAWNKILQWGGKEEKSITEHIVSVSVGYGSLPLPSEAETLLHVAHDTTLKVFFPVMAVVVVLFVWLARTSNLLRDLGPELLNENGNPIPRKDKYGTLVPQRAALWWLRSNNQYKTDKSRNVIYEPARKTYSLASSQLAFWLFIILGAYVFIWTAASNQQSLSKFALGILGISSATAVSSVFIDSSKRAAATAERQALADKLKELQSQQATLEQAVAAGDNSAPEKLEAVKQEIIDTQAAIDKPVASQPSRGFWADILSDATGVTIHRFQIAAWTVVLGLVFVVTVITSLTMPDYDGTLLALMGISSGAYIGLKPTENAPG
jgi:hypothetical protein